MMGNEIEWLTPQSEYRPTEYVQGWLSFWFDDQKRLSVARQFQQQRIAYIKQIWSSDKDLLQEGFDMSDETITQALNTFTNRIEQATKVNQLLLTEAELTKKLYKAAMVNTHITDFVRDYNGVDKANAFLNHGNYLAYGLGATTLWVLGIPHGFAVMHGKTRRGALVFDVADLIKDAIILPWAFICARENLSEQDYRQQVLQKFTQHKSLDFMFECVKRVAMQSNNL